MKSKRETVGEQALPVCRAAAARVLLLCVLLSVWLTAVAGEDDWQKQSWQQSKRLPDLHHAVDIKLPETMQPPETFALKPGRVLQCSTCHGLEKMAETAYDKVDKNAPDFLRGGPYRELNSFCYQCHDKKSRERPNIHVMLDKNGAIKKQNCEYCHEEVHEKRDEPLQASQLKLRLPVEKMCLGCHLKTPHLNAVEHQEAKPKPEMKQTMQAQAKQQGIVLPLSAEGKVLCVSCHTPHPEGVIDSTKNPAGKQVGGDVEKGVEYANHSWDKVYQADKEDRLLLLGLENKGQYVLPYQRIKTEVLLRLPAKNGELCLSCHAFED